MKFEEYQALDAIALADAIRRKQISPTDALEACIARIEAVNPKINAVVHRMDDYARKQIQEGLPDGPFTGVPFLIKDLGAMIAGVPQSNGSRYWAGFTPTEDATLVQRYRAAGVTFSGKTNTPELGLVCVTEPVALGSCRNPWNLSRNAGGSSGGATAAVAAGIVPVAHATDGGGSIRLPAAHCGLVGLKPTRARTPLGPLVGEGWAGLAHAHVVSHTVRDSAAFLDATAGAALGDPYAAPHHAGTFLAEVGAPTGKLRIALGSLDGVHPEVAEGVRATAALLESMGHHVEEADIGVPAEQVSALLWTIVSSNVATVVGFRAEALGRPPREEELEPVTRAMLAKAEAMKPQDYIRAVTYMHGIGRRVAAFFQNYDVALGPVWKNPPQPLGAMSMQNPSVEDFAAELRGEMPFTPIYNLSGCPAISLPLHRTKDGLPVGVHLGSSVGKEGLLLRLAAQLEQANPWIAFKPDFRSA